MLDAEMVARVRASWGLVARAPRGVAERFYARLFDIEPSLRPLFTHTDMDHQGDKLVQTLAVVVAGLDDLGRLRPAITALGQRHRGYGVQMPHYDVVGQALLDTLAEFLGDAFEPPVRAAWATAYTAVAECMREAASSHSPAS